MLTLNDLSKGMSKLERAYLSCDHVWEEFWFCKKCGMGMNEELEKKRLKAQREEKDDCPPGFYGKCPYHKEVRG
jgi:hypothetical protein